MAVLVVRPPGNASVYVENLAAACWQVRKCPGMWPIPGLARGGNKGIGRPASNLWKSVTIRRRRPVGESSRAFAAISLINFSG